MLRNYFSGPKSASKYPEKINSFTTRSLSLFQSSPTIGTANAQSYVIARSGSRLLFHLCMHWLRSSANPLLPTGHPRSCAQSSTLFHSPHPRGRVIFSVDTSFVCLEFRSDHYATCNRTPGIHFGHHFITPTKTIREGFLETKITEMLELQHPLTPL